MMPLTLVPPAQAEALYDAQDGAQIEDRFALMPWLDDDYAEDESRTKIVPFTDHSSRNRPFAQMRAA